MEESSLNHLHEMAYVFPIGKNFTEIFSTEYITQSGLGQKTGRPMILNITIELLCV